MFIDEMILTVRSGAGGDGCSAFRREKYVPMGGPAGGDGGRGGDVVLRADPQMTTFGDMPAERVLRAEPGGRGEGSNRHGKNGTGVVVLVPPGTTVFDAETGLRLADLVDHGEEWVAARGGRGGLGNARFATSTDQAPTRTTQGGAAVERRLRLELRLLADVGLVGLPNAGKSTLLARLSRATPRIADYPFTTLEPYLGIVDLPDFTRFVLADLPGLIEGAHQGKGLGDRFLRHVERTRVMLHLVDLFPTDGSDPVDNWRTIRQELSAYGHGLSGRLEVIAGTKADLGDPAPVVARLVRAAGGAVYPISAVTGAGLKPLLTAVAAALKAQREAPEAWERPEPPSTAPAGARKRQKAKKGGKKAAGSPTARKQPAKKPRAKRAVAQAGGAPGKRPDRGGASRRARRNRRRT